MKKRTLNIDLADNTLQHLCCNDTVDIVIIKEGNKYSIKVLSLKNSNINVDVELIDFDKFKDLTQN